LYIEIEGVSKVYNQKNEKLQVLDDISLEINQGEFICLLGPSGCGKSTLLSAIAGFEKPDTGTIRINGIEVKNPSPKYVTIFQNYGLLPWRSVLKNVELGLENKRISRQDKHKIAREFLDLVGLIEFESSHPHQLSGGMQQRVSIARALAVNPEILFMDEPFGALDAITRIKMQNDILEIAKKTKKTVIFVTHDIEEAVYLADRIVVMTPNPGKIKSIVQVGKSSLRDRTSPDFLLARDKVFEIFNMKSEEKLDYVI
jgi:ABC-type nitrate/sulfonate/bicarbonate transport system, ATPase component